MIIYYFSGTGNSYAIAKELIVSKGDQLVAINTNTLNAFSELKEDVIGFVFPVYHQGVPNIVKQFIMKMPSLQGKYIFGICTYGDSPSTCLVKLKQLVESQDGQLAAGFGVQMPYNYMTPSLTIKGFFYKFKLRSISEIKQQKMFARWDQEKDNILTYIKQRQKGDIMVRGKGMEALSTRLQLKEKVQKKAWLKVARVEAPYNKSFEKSICDMDRGFFVDQDCVSCGICLKLCPVNNIRLDEGKPTWQHRCEQCFACLQWCPKEAIQYSPLTKKGPRYSHPLVKLEDMILRNK